jgi:hypothetical protein
MNGLSIIVPPTPTPSMVSPNSNSVTRIKFGNFGHRNRFIPADEELEIAREVADLWGE